MEFKQSCVDFDFIKQQKVNAKIERSYKLIRQLADAIYFEENSRGEESKDEGQKYQPDTASQYKPKSIQTQSPTEICLVYLREKIAQS